MTQEEAVSLLRRYGRNEYRYRTHGYIWCAKRNTDYRTSVYGRFLIGELIRKIKNSTDDPIRVVQRFHNQMDDMLGDSDDDHFETHQFAARMECETGEILGYLKCMEDEK